MSVVQQIAQLNYRPPLLKQGSTDPKHLALLFHALREHAVWQGKANVVPEVYDADMVRSVRKLQSYAKIETDGVCGPQTWAWLGVHGIVTKAVSRLAHGDIVLAFARHEAFRGSREYGGNNKGKDVERFLKGTGMGAVAWCVAYASYCEIQAAEWRDKARILKERLSSSRLYREGRDHGFLTSNPRPGDYALLKDPRYDPKHPKKGVTSHKHTTLFAYQDGPYAVVWEGNVRPRKWIPWQLDAVRQGRYLMKDMDFVESCA